MAQPLNFHHYLSVADRTMEWGLYVTGAGRVLDPRTQVYPFQEHPERYHFTWNEGRTLPEFAMVLVTDGAGVFESRETGKVGIGDGSLIFLFPGVWHRYRPLKGARWAERWISFNGDIAYRLLNQNLIRPDAPIHSLGPLTTLAQPFDQLLESIQADPTQNPVLLSLHAMGLLAKAIAATGAHEVPSKPTGKKSDDPMVARAIDLIWSHSFEPLTVPRVAAAIGANRRTLERRFQEFSGHSILQEINQCRFTRAKRLLVETDLAIKHIVSLAGFTSEERMRVTFVKNEGMPPLTYRETHRPAT
jgi:AraC-like DNA-binding protein